MKFYVAGKLGTPSVPQYIKNCRKMIDTAIALKKKGHQAYCPCVDLLIGLVAGDWNYEDYRLSNLAWVDVSDALFLMKSWRWSKGARREKERAEKLGIPIYRKLKEVTDANE